ncbi:hypothetical protein [Xanthomonas campestris]|uniref:hypothetical protein n=1 Tax=Xanthomonas campestris TaxID=339 RepID=UPI00225DDDA8
MEVTATATLPTGRVAAGLAGASVLVGVFAEDFETGTGFLDDGVADFAGFAGTALGAGAGAGLAALTGTDLAGAGVVAGFGTDLVATGLVTGLAAAGAALLAAGLAALLATGFTGLGAAGFEAGAGLAAVLVAGAFLATGCLAAGVAFLAAGVAFLAAGLAAAGAAAFLATGLADFLAAWTAFCAVFLAATKRSSLVPPGPGKAGLYSLPHRPPATTY